MEDGEIHDSTYDPAFEWPGESSITQEHSPYPYPETLSRPLKSPSISILRLLVTQTSILPRQQKLVILDGYEELQFGRDVAPAGTETPRIRLKEMEVSKVHATVFWDKDRQSWSIVDMGSKHGTFVRSFMMNSPGRILRPGEDIRGIRLSLSKVASMPKKLYHLDSVTIGSTTFVVHIHEDRLPCIECTAGAASEVPLFGVLRQEAVATVSKRSWDAAEIDHNLAVGSSRDHKKALTMLKHSLLSLHNTKAPFGDVNSKGSSYVDRSARRRALHPGSRPDAPGMSNVLSTPLYQPYLPPADAAPSRPARAPPLEPISLSIPLSENNIGHRLLMKQGWQPGMSLGLPDEPTGETAGLIEPIEVNINTRRAGLGMPVQDVVSVLSLSSSSDWREDSKQRRWGTIRRSD